MKYSQFNLKRTTFFVLVLLFAFLGSASAQYSLRWMNVGSMHSPYSEGLAAPEGLPYDNAPVQFPAVDFHSGHSRAQGFWIALKNFTDEKGRNLSYKVIQTGPRPQSDLHFSPLETKVVSRWDPIVTVDGIKSFKDFVTVDEIDPTLVPDRQIRMNVNSRVGINTNLVVSAFSNEYHDNYHILEYRFTNTGNVDSDEEVELNNSLEGVYFFYISRYAQQEASAWVGSGGNVWGKFTMNDAIHDGMEDFPVDFRAQYAWGGWDAGQTAFNNMGGPLVMEHWIGDVDTTGRLGDATFVGRVYLHADKSTSDHSDDPGQPSTMGVWGSDSPDLPADEFNEELSRLKYENHIATGRLLPHHADDIEPSGDFAHPTNPPNIFREEYDEGGYAMIEGFGPYNMGIGEYIDVHIAEGAAGLSVDAATKIGRAYKSAGFDDDANFDYGDTSMTKNEWVMTAKDSIIQMFKRARAAYAADMAVPSPPAPPKTFTVHSLPNNIDLQ